MKTLTCWSCGLFRKTGCVAGLSAWPNAKLTECKMADYEPGADEPERNEPGVDAPCANLSDNN